MREKEGGEMKTEGRGIVRNRGREKERRGRRKRGR